MRSVVPVAAVDVDPADEVEGDDAEENTLRVPGEERLMPRRLMTLGQAAPRFYPPNIRGSQQHYILLVQTLLQY